MPSREGFETWLNYEFLILKLVVAGSILYWVAQRLLDYLGRSALPTGQIILYASGVLILLSIVLAWWIGREDQ